MYLTERMYRSCIGGFGRCACRSGISEMTLVDMQSRDMTREYWVCYLCCITMYLNPGFRPRNKQVEKTPLTGCQAPRPYISLMLPKKKISAWPSS